MAMITMADLRARALQRADHVNSGFVTSAELDFLLNESYGEYVDLIEDEVGPEFLARQVTLTATPGQSTYTVGDGTTHPYMYKLLSVQMQYLNMLWPIEYGSFLDMQRPDAGLGWISPGGVKVHVSSLDATTGQRQIAFWPAPQAAQTMIITYVPMLPALSEAGETFSDGGLIQGFVGWDQFVVLSTAIKILLKEESDTAALEREMDKLSKRIQQAAARSMAGRTDVVQDVSTMQRPSIRNLPWWDR